jgi:hypothetical protein
MKFFKQAEFTMPNIDMPNIDMSSPSVIGGGVAAAASAAVLGTGAYAGAKIPGLRGGHGPIKGSLLATKKVFYDIPAHMLSGGKRGKSIYEAILNAKTHEIKLDPKTIREYSNAKARLEFPDFDSLSPIEKFEKSKAFDLSSAKRLLDEGEQVARQSGARYIAGASHFTPQTAAMMGYQVAPEVLPSTNKALWKKYYYNTTRKNSLNKLKNKGLTELDELDAYWLTANPTQVRLLKKDLSVSPGEAREQAMKILRDMPASELQEATKAELAFKANYDNLNRTIIKERMGNV